MSTSRTSLEARRMRTMWIMLAACVVCIMVAGLVRACSQVSERANQQMFGAFAYSDDETHAAAFLPLLFPLDDFEIVGVSQDGKVIGLSSPEKCEQVILQVDRGMRAAGWCAQAGGEQGALSYVRLSDDVEQPTFALLFVQECAAGTSVVVQLL